MFAMERASQNEMKSGLRLSKEGNLAITSKNITNQSRGPFMLGVFITLLYTHTMPNIYYCSTCMLLYPHLMAKLVLRVGRKSRFFPDLRHETRQHGAVKVWWRDLQSCWECSSPCYAFIQCHSSTMVAPACCYTHTWWANLSKKWRWKLRLGLFPDQRHESCQHGAVKVWLRALESCWECSSLCYTSIQCQTSTIVAPACCYTIPPLDGQTCLRVGRKSRFFPNLSSEAWNLPTWGCKSMVEGPRIMLGVFITLLYIHTMPNIYYCSTCMLLYPHLMAKRALKLAGNWDFLLLIWGMKPANNKWW